MAPGLVTAAGVLGRAAGGSGSYFAPPPDSKLRWLDEAYYEEAVSGFNMYDPEQWLPTLKLAVGRFMFWPWTLLTCWTLSLTIYIEFFAPEEHREFVSMKIDAHVIMGGALAFLIVMRTDASMNRWAEARNAWQTTIDCCLSLGAQTAPLMKDAEYCERVLMQLMAFVMSLKAFLRDEKVSTEEVGPRMDWQHMNYLNRSHFPPIIALKILAETVRKGVPQGQGADMHSAIFDETSEQIRVINHAVGTMQRIKTTPMTLGYVTTLRSFLILWLATMPLACVGMFGWLATPVLSFVAYLFINIEQMAVEIEQPFGNDANDLPQEEYIVQLQRMLIEMVPGFEPEPREDEDQETNEWWEFKRQATMARQGSVQGMQYQQPPPPEYYGVGPGAGNGGYQGRAYPAQYGRVNDPYGGNRMAA